MPDTSTDGGLTRGERAAALFPSPTIHSTPFGYRSQIGRDAIARVLVSLRASIVHDIAPDREIVDEAVALVLIGAHTGADREETETLLLTLRAYLAARIEQAAILSLPVRRDGPPASARRVLGQSLHDSAHSTGMVTRLAAAIRHMSDADVAAEPGELSPHPSAPGIPAPRTAARAT